MKEQTVDPLKQALAQILNKATTEIDKGVDFLNSQLPEVIEQLLLWKMWESLIQNLLCLMGIFAPLIIVIYIRKPFKDWVTNDIPELFIPVGIGGGIVSFVSIILSAQILNLTWLQIWLAPKIYLIEYAAELFK